LSPEALTFSAGELEYLARLLGGRFPGLAGGAPPAAGVRSELAERGILDESGALDDGRARAALRCALSGSALTLAACDGARACRVTFFLTPAAIVRHELLDADRHKLELSDHETVRAHLDEIADAVATAAAGLDVAPALVGHERLSDATRLVAAGDEAAAIAALPEAPGYVAALSDVRLVATVAAHARHGDEIEMTSVSVVHSPSHGLWLVDTTPGGEDVAIERVSATDLARRLAALLAAVAPPPATA